MRKYVSIALALAVLGVMTSESASARTIIHHRSAHHLYLYAPGGSNPYDRPVFETGTAENQGMYDY